MMPNNQPDPPTRGHAGTINGCTRHPFCSMRFLLLVVVLSLMANVPYARRFMSSKEPNVILAKAKKGKYALIAGQTSPSKPGNNSTTIERMSDAVKDVPHALEMEENHLNLSGRHQLKFHARKLLIANYFPKTILYTASANEAAILTKEFAYLHIFKSGGTTIQLQTGVNHQRSRDVLNYKWLTFVRDPIDHFLSGWAECGFREYQWEHNHTIDPSPYDTRIQNWLQDILTHALPPPYPSAHWCSTHSQPQANFILNGSGAVHPNLELVGDLRELPGVLGLVGFAFNSSKEGGRIASENKIKHEYYPSRTDLISNSTMRKICEFVALDYYLFDFEPPEVCKDIPIISSSSWMDPR